MKLKIAVILVCLVIFSPGRGWADALPVTQNKSKPVNHAFAPGEKLTYNVSWSTIIEAGIAVMEVKAGQTVDGRQTYEFVSTTHSVGLLELVYPVRDRVVSVVDADGLYSLSFNLQELHGKKRRTRIMTFDPEKGTVVERLNEDPPETFKVPPRVEDALSSLYYLRTLQDLTIGKTVVVNVHDSEKDWAVEVHVLGKKRITTPAGTFDTIEVKTYPKYEGVFMNKGEIYIWLTDDARKIPVLMKSVISIGSIVATLTKIEGGKNNP